MFFRSSLSHKIFRALAVSLMLLCGAAAAFAQAGDLDDEGEADPIKLFERGQDEHARGEFEKALEFYDEAIKLRPEFPEAEYQRATALISLGRVPEAEKALRRAVELRPTWATPNALLGDLLTHQKRFTEAEQALNQALKLEPKNPTALVALADLRLQTKPSREVLLPLLGQLRDATTGAGTNVSLWLARGSVERALDDKPSALTSFERALSIDPKNVAAHVERAEIYASAGETERAIASARAAQRLAPISLYATSALARAYLRAGDCAAASGALDQLDAATQRPSETGALRSEIALQCVAGDKERPALEEALKKEPRSARIMARLCALYRKDDPPRALEYCRRALEVEPDNADYATGYAAALVQARRFAEAVAILRQVIDRKPDNYVAHTNLAIALYEMKRFREALAEYRWILTARPETTAAYFFIATAHDNLGEFPEALAAYESFLQHADPQQYQLEIDKVNLRLPSLRNQIKLKQGAKKKS